MTRPTPDPDPVQDPDRDTARVIAAFAETAAVIARESDLGTVLDLLAEQVRVVTGMPTCAILLVDEDTEALHHVGSAGLPVDYPERVERARRTGVPMTLLEAYRTRRTVVDRHSRARVLGDPRWFATQSIVRESEWDVFISVPLVLRGKAIGVLTGFSPAGEEPTDSDVHFIEVMADHAAIAVDNARMSAQLALRAAEGERQRLARDLHDSVSQALFSLSLQARGIELRLGEGADPDLARELGELRGLAQEALGEMRALIECRRPAELEDEGLLRAVVALAEQISRRTGLTVEVLADERDGLGLGPGIEDDLFRLVQEALNNVVRHARARSVVVRLERAAQSLVIEVTDDGVGLGEPAGVRSHFGMQTMRERAARHGAAVSIGPAPGGGTRVRTEVPLASRDGRRGDTATTVSTSGGSPGK
jgi:signal transduction histidine kinase